MRVDHDELLVDIGSKSEGVIPAREFSSLPDDERKNINVGDKMLVFVVQPENQEGHAVVSIDRARQEKSWRILQEQYERGEVIGAEVVNYNKGGLLVNLDGVRGFVPASQVTEIRGGDDAQKQADMARLIGSRLQLKIIEINRHRNRLILSERQALQERRDVMKEKLIEELREGEVRKGRVSSICDFGAFVDVGGADGLVHLSELSWSRVRHPSEVLSIGQEVEVFVLGINAEEKKIALSIKRTQAEPWSRVAANYDVNQLVIGTVTQLANFGAFARIEDGIEGLVHVSELSDARISHPRQLVHEGQELLLRIIRIDPQRRRMGLSLRRALEATDEEVEIALDQDAVELKHRLLELEVEPDPNADEEFERRERAERAERAERDEAASATAEPAADDAANPENISADTVPTGASEAPEQGGFGDAVGSMASAMADAMAAAASKAGDLASAVAERVSGGADEAPTTEAQADADESAEPVADATQATTTAETETSEAATPETAPVAEAAEAGTDAEPAARKTRSKAAKSEESGAVGDDNAAISDTPTADAIAADAATDAGTDGAAKEPAS
jgi:small subunit ribosomal protein S1